MIERTKEWKAGYATGCRHTKDAVWGAVYDYVHRHNPTRAEEMKRDVVAALTDTAALVKVLASGVDVREAWYCEPCAVAVYDRRCPHCGKLERDKH